MDYIANLKKSLKLVWENKFLWILGFIASFAVGNGSGSSGSGSDFSRLYNSDLTKGTLTPTPTLKGLEGLTSQDPTIFIILMICLVLVFIIIGLIFTYLGHRGQSGLIQSAALLDDGHTSNFSKSWSLGRKKVWSIWLQKVVLGLPTLILIFPIVVLAIFIAFSSETNKFNTDSLAPLSILLIVLLCCFGIIALIYGILMSILTPITIREMIFENKGIIEGIKSGFELFKKNFKDVLVSFLLQFVATIPYSLVTGLILVVLIITIMIPAVFAGIAFQSPWGIVALVCGGLAVIWIIGSVFSSALIAFQETYWTIVYKKLKR